MDGLTDGQTDMTKPMVSFHIFVNMPKKQSGPVTILAESQTGDVCGPTRLFWNLCWAAYHFQQYM